MPLSDKKVWETYTKNVKRLTRDKPKPFARRTAKDSKPQPAASSKAEQKKSVAPTPVSPPKKPIGSNKDKKIGASVQLDKKTERRLRQGEIGLEARLDLHGLTQEKAYAALTRFIEAQATQGRRRLLVITGKGVKGESVLRATLPRWCEARPLVEHILALRPAAPKHGGSGAWYVLLRRRPAH